MRGLSVLMVMAAIPSGAAAEVKSATPIGFEVERSVTIAAPPAAVYAALGRIGAWWDPAHSYSGDSKNLSISLRPGGCFCEAMPEGGGAEHARVVHVMPGRSVRLRGGLGPLQAEGADGALTWTIKAVPGGSVLTQGYVVGGYIRSGAEALAPLVDGVLGEQLERLKAYAEKAR